LSLNCSSDNLSSFLLLIGYADYTELLYDLHSVQTLKGKKEEAVSFLEYTNLVICSKICSHSFHLSIAISNIGETKVQERGDASTHRPYSRPAPSFGKAFALFDNKSKLLHYEGTNG